MRRHVHPLTPLIQAVTALPASAFSVVAFIIATGVTVSTNITLILIAVFVLIPLLIAGYGFLAWQRLWFWFDEDGDFRVDSGVLMRNERRVQLSRLQTVDIVQPLIPRIFGFATVVIEVAGVSDSRVQLRYLKKQDASDLRAEVIARAAGVQPEAGEAPEEPITRVPPGRLAVALALRSSTVGLVSLTALILVVNLLREGWGGVVLAIVTGALPVALIIGEFITYYGFTITSSPDGLRMRYGLLQTQRRTVPPGRVQAVDIVEPLLWRRLGWVRVRVNIAGVGGDSSQQRETLITPVSPRHEALDIIHRVFPQWDPDSVQWQQAPRRARWRAPLQWSVLAAGWSSSMFTTRRGRITRHQSLIPHSRTQSVRLQQGPWQRQLKLATVCVDSTPGPVRVLALQQGESEALQLTNDQAVRAQIGRSHDPAARWIRDAPHTTETDEHPCG
jgi:putative membrane protein